MKSRAVVVFGLNELSGKTIDSQGSAVGAWNSSNAESLIRYTVNKGYNIIHGWELGKKFYAHIWILEGISGSNLLKLLIVVFLEKLWKCNIQRKYSEGQNLGTVSKFFF